MQGAQDSKLVWDSQGSEAGGGRLGGRTEGWVDGMLERTPRHRWAERASTPLLALAGQRKALGLRKVSCNFFFFFF